MTPEQVALVTSSMPRVRACAQQLTEQFYAALFRTRPDARAMFPDDLTELRGKFMVELDAIVSAISDLDAFAGRAKHLGAMHRGHGVGSAHYVAGGAALLEAVAAVLAHGWSKDLEQAWSAAYSMVSQTMLRGGYEKADDDVVSARR